MTDLNPIRMFAGRDAFSGKEMLLTAIVVALSGAAASLLTSGVGTLTSGALAVGLASLGVGLVLAVVAAFIVWHMIPDEA